MSRPFVAIDDVAAAKRFLLEGYGDHEVADALGLPIRTVNGLWKGKYPRVQPLGRHRMCANLTAYVVKRDTQRLAMLELRAEVREAELELAALNADTP